MNKKWCIHKRFSPVYTEILGSDFVSLAMYRGLADDFRSVFGQLRSFFSFSFFLVVFTAPLFLFKTAGSASLGVSAGELDVLTRWEGCVCHPLRCVDDESLSISLRFPHVVFYDMIQAAPWLFLIKADILESSYFAFAILCCPWFVKHLKIAVVLFFTNEAIIRQ